MSRRIPDIFGTVRATPDLLAIPYSIFGQHQEIEHAFLCLGGWQPAPNNRREAHFADVNGVRLFVQKTVRADRCPLARSDEYQARVNGIRVGEFVGLAVAQRAAIAAATKKAPALSRGGVWWC